eukprot:COSAG02_NODE_865_length_16381_cov_14.799533_5_plen_194_part_00
MFVQASHSTPGARNSPTTSVHVEESLISCATDCPRTHSTIAISCTSLAATICCLSAAVAAQGPGKKISGSATDSRAYCASRRAPLPHRAQLRPTCRRAAGWSVHTAGPDGRAQPHQRRRQCRDRASGRVPRGTAHQHRPATARPQRRGRARREGDPFHVSRAWRHDGKGDFHRDATHGRHQLIPDGQTQSTFG